MCDFLCLLGVEHLSPELDCHGCLLQIFNTTFKKVYNLDVLTCQFSLGSVGVGFTLNSRLFPCTKVRTEFSKCMM